jgi:hypothetical protein
MTDFWEVRTKPMPARPEWGGCLVLSWFAAMHSGTALIKATEDDIAWVRQDPHVTGVAPASEGTTYVDTTTGLAWRVERGEARQGERS